ncbi:hypothetical protein [Halarchaeum sp. P4]|uniref:hypothetical protein n=1 Tax=Halarchaeum sp. P4 TaxID=3421639 RepID=UPI003EBCB243
MDRRDATRALGAGAIAALAGCAVFRDGGDDAHETPSTVTVASERTSPSDLGVANWTSETLAFDVRVRDDGASD